MTGRIQRLRAYIMRKEHHAFRLDTKIDSSIYRDTSVQDHVRVARRMRAILDAEQPVLLPEERIAFTRTIYPPEAVYSDEELREIQVKHYMHEMGTLGNVVPDFGIILRDGLLSQIEKIEDNETAYNKDYLDCVRMGIEGILGLVERYADYAQDHKRFDIATVLRRVPANGAKTFREALQSLRVLYFAMWCEGNHHIPLGRFDQYMMPYLKRDLEEGRLMPEEAFELLEEFFLSCNRDSDLYPTPMDGDNGQSMTLGGMTPEGEEAFNELSRMCLQASAELLMIDPKINLRVSSKTPMSIFEMGMELTKLGLGFPQYSNDDVIIPGLMKLGYGQSDARDYAIAGRWEPVIPKVGMDVPDLAGISLAGIVNDAIREELNSVKDMQDLMASIGERLASEAKRIATAVRRLYIIPSPFMSIFFSGCVGHARDVTLGCRYNHFGIHLTGISTAVNSLVIIEQLIFDQSFSKKELLAILEKDFEGEDALLDEIRHDYPKMGSDNEMVDQYACMLIDAFADALRGFKNARGGTFRPGTGSAEYCLSHGAALGATPDGRKAGDMLSADFSPTFITELNNPILMLRSFAKPDMQRAINGGPVTIEFSDTGFRSNTGITKAAQLIRAFIANGGHQLQINATNQENLKNAQLNPEHYKNLIVRVWGFSTYFVNLDERCQEQIMRRMPFLI